MFKCFFLFILWQITFHGKTLKNREYEYLYIDVVEHSLSESDNKEETDHVFF